MILQSQIDDIVEKVRQAAEKLGEALNDWINRKRRQAPVPVPIDRPYQKRHQH